MTKVILEKGNVMDIYWTNVLIKCQINLRDKIILLSRLKLTLKKLKTFAEWITGGTIQCAALSFVEHILVSNQVRMEETQT